MSTLLPEHLKSARALLGYNRDEFSKIAGVSRNTIARIENDENVTINNKNHVLSTLEKLGITLIQPSITGFVGVKKKYNN